LMGSRRDRLARFSGVIRLESQHPLPCSP
jgi:hypothetical protein